MGDFELSKCRSVFLVVSMNDRRRIGSRGQKGERLRRRGIDNDRRKKNNNSSRIVTESLLAKTLGGGAKEIFTTSHCQMGHLSNSYRLINEYMCILGS